MMKGGAIPGDRIEENSRASERPLARKEFLEDTLSSAPRNSIYLGPR